MHNLEEVFIVEVKSKKKTIKGNNLTESYFEDLKKKDFKK